MFSCSRRFREHLTDFLANRARCLNRPPGFGQRDRFVIPGISCDGRIGGQSCLLLRFKVRSEFRRD